MEGREQEMKKIFLVVFAIAIVFNVRTIDAYALESGVIAVLDELDLPKDLDFSVNDTCSGHLYYVQASAREDGSFAICTHYYENNNPTDDTFYRQYIDIYNADGTFWGELSFRLSTGYSMELTDETINLYMLSSVLVYDFETGDVRHYSIPYSSLYDSGLYNELREKEFVCGDWKYYCVKSWGNYTKLVRDNDMEEQVLIDMKGTYQFTWWYYCGRDKRS